MKILLDECVPVQVAKALAGHEVTTVQRLGLAGRENGDVLAAAE
jgi:predicted nuclease of predicted toxin-antitoxin system